jgi:flagellar biosynthetic protein FliO
MRDGLASFWRALTARYPWVGRLPGWAWALLGGGWLLLTVLLLGASGLGGASTTDAAIPGANATLDLVAVSANVLFKLGIVLLLLYGSLYALRQWQRNGQGAGVRRLNIVESQRLSPRQTLHLVRLDDQTLLIGATDAGIHLIAEVASAAVKEIHEIETNAHTQPGSPAESDFAAEFLRRLS